MHDNFLTIFSANCTFRPPKGRKSSQSSYVSCIYEIPELSQILSMKMNMNTNRQISVYASSYPPLSRMWRSTRTAHTDFPATTHRDSISTALLSLLCNTHIFETPITYTLSQNTSKTAYYCQANKQKVACISNLARNYENHQPQATVNHATQLNC